MAILSLNGHFIGCNDVFLNSFFGIASQPSSLPSSLPSPSTSCSGTLFDMTFPALQLSTFAALQSIVASVAAGEVVVVQFDSIWVLGGGLFMPVHICLSGCVAQCAGVSLLSHYFMIAVPAVAGPYSPAPFMSTLGQSAMQLCL